MVRADTSAPATQVRVERGADPDRAGPRARRRYHPPGADLPQRAQPPAGPAAGGGRCACPALRRGVNRLVVTAEDMAGNIAVRNVTLRGPR